MPDYDADLRPPAAARYVIVALDQRAPMLNGVHAVEKYADAQAHGNKGEAAARPAIEMANRWEPL